MNNNEEPNTAPEPDRWYNINLGSSFKDHHNHPKFYTFRYEFKPASIDKSQPGSLHQAKNNKVKVEYQNNQHGKFKSTFEGVSEDYKENDAVLFFDGETFKLERLHRAVKRLRHVRLPDEPAAAAAVAAPPAETCSSPFSKDTNQQPFNKDVAYQLQGQVEQLGTSNSDSSESKEDKVSKYPVSPPNPSATSPDVNNSEPQAHLDIATDLVVDLANRENVAAKESRIGLDIDINLPHQAETDDEIADVDISDGETEEGPNAAEALRAQVNAEERKEQHSSSRSSSGSDSSTAGSETGSESESSSSDSKNSNSDSISV